MWLRIVAIFIVVCLRCHAVQRTEAKAQLRSMARLPRMDLPFGLSFDPLGGFDLLNEVLDPALELEKVRKKIAKDPSDAVPFIQLGRVYDASGDSSKAYAAYLHAVELARRENQLDPGNGLLCSELGTALALTGRMDEAAAKHHEAVLASPDDWKCWLRLGQFEERRAVESFIGQSIARKRVGVGDTLSDLARARPSLDRIEKAQRLLADASVDLRKAARLATNNPEALIQHGLFCSLSNSVRVGTEVLRGSDGRAEPISRAAFCEPALREFNRALLVDPKDYRAIGLAVWYTVFVEASDRTGGGFNGITRSDIWANLSDQTQSRVRGLMSRLGALGENSDSEISAGALEVLGLIQELLLKDDQGAERSLRSAITLDPHRERAWDALVAVLGNAHRYDDLLELSRRRVQARPNQRNFLLLAKAFEKAGDDAEAQRDVQVALELDSADFLANLSLANLLLKQKETASSWRIRDALNKAQKSMGGHPSKNQMIDLALTQSLYYALNDNTETARKILKGILEVARDNSEVREALSVVGY